VTTLEMEMRGEIQPGELCSPIIDLRQYTLFPGARNEFVELFDREFVETQEAVGMRVIGQFRDLGDPNRFVWIRGFPDTAARARALKAFYVESEAWKKHSSQARAMMIDSSDALLLRPARSNSGFLLPPADDRPGLHSPPSDGVIAASIYTLASAADAGFLDFFDGAVAPLVTAAGGSILASFVTENSPNNFPPLPLREGENVYVSFCAYSNLSAYHDALASLGRNDSWRREIWPALLKRIHSRPHVVRLVPTSRSQVRP
jgi:hypothetical protein